MIDNNDEKNDNNKPIVIYENDLVRCFSVDLNYFNK